MKEVPKRGRDIYLVLENIQYARNVASIFRTADAAGVRRIYLTGISQKPPFGKDLQKASRAKEKSVSWEYADRATEVLQKLKRAGYFTVAVELTDSSHELAELPTILRGKEKICLVLGSEVYGVTNETLAECDSAVFIPLYGKGASMNVSASAAIVLYSF